MFDYRTFALNLLSEKQIFKIKNAIKTSNYGTKNKTNRRRTANSGRI